MRALSAALVALLIVGSAVADERAQGVDLSHFSGKVDWDLVAQSGLHFVFLKASEGVDAPDPAFAAHWAEAKRVGLRRGAYHFFIAEDDGRQQAKLFLSQVRLEPGDLPPVVDVETLASGTTEQLRRNLAAFVSAVSAETGVQPMVYTGPNFWQEHLGGGYADHPLWVAHSGVPEPTVPRDWEAWHFWQYRENGRLDGVEKDVDFSWFRGDPVALAAFANTPTSD